MPQLLHANKRIKITLKPERDDKTPGQLDGLPVYSSSDEAIVTYEPDLTLDAAGLIGWLTAHDVVGQALIRAIGDGDLGAGVRQLVYELEVATIPPDTTILAAEIGAEEDRP